MTGKLKNNVAVVDVVQTKHAPKNDQNIQEIMFGIVSQLLNRVGVDRSEIGTVISSSSDYWMGISCSNNYYYGSVGANLKSGSKVAEDSIFAFLYGFMRILSGDYKTALVVSVTKSSECPSEHTLTNIGADPFFQRPVGLNDLSLSALRANFYMSKHQVTSRDFANVVVKNTSNAIKNPYSHITREVTVEDVQNSTMLAYPLRRLDVPETGDGAVAMLLAEADIAKQLTERPVSIQGVGWSTKGSHIGSWDLNDSSLTKAARRAFAMAGITHPGREIDVAEICDTTSFEELFCMEQLGFCEEGKACRYVNEGKTMIGGDLPINPSGGLFGANPYIARGLIRVAEAVLQIKGEAEGHQVDGVQRALAQSRHGIGGQAQSVVVLGNS